MQILTKLNLKQVRALAAGLAYKHKDKDFSLGLSGSLGSGKTTFIKAFAAALGIKKIASPTFIIMSAFSLPGKRRLYHLDLYRITKLDELDALGLGEILASRRRIVVVEWIDKFPKLAKKCNMLIHLDIVNQSKRNVHIMP
ncbi:MAG: tRNA (adenosine(37)-N6)-threonylcarbamoyltransferase complex ATPase subunit type 1 TsaE [Candidatus Doudnabacteria bacterium]|nr:tRNA (adenosine(37)-N6)-threonylcarbamoyltransferase complex ATPase subunit type 1 TsaE [Candidatus Doudnabacteria bacterium]